MFWRLLVKVSLLDNNEGESNREKETKKREIIEYFISGRFFVLGFHLRADGGSISEVENQKYQSIYFI